MPVLSPIEQFLLRLERNERDVFSHNLDHVLLPIVPFFQLVHVVNIDHVLRLLSQFEQGEGSALIRIDGFLTLAAEEKSIPNEDLRRWTINLFDAMRF